MEIKKRTSSKIDSIFFLILIIISTIYIIKNFFNLKTINSVKSENELLLYSVDYYKSDNSLQNKVIGTRLNLNSLLFIGGKNHFNYQKYKIIIIADIGSCQLCYKQATFFYENYIKKSKLKDRIDLCLVIPSKNVGYANNAFHDIINKGISVFVDTSFIFSKDLGVPTKNAAVLFLNANNICVYSYIIEKDNVSKESNKSNMFRNIINNSDDLIIRKKTKK